MKTKSHPGLIESIRSRMASRSRRLMRLRATALPIRLLTEKPKRLYGKWLGRTHRTNSSLVYDRPSRRISWNRLFCRTR